MFSIPHLIIIFVVALVVFGPEKLPELARNFGKIMSEFKKATGDLRSTFEGHLRDLERETDQRRMNREAATAATATAVLSPSAETVSAASTASSAAGTIPTVPSHLSAPDVVPEATQEPSDPQTISQNTAPQEGAVSESATGQPSPTLQPEHNPETLTDAGIHPA